MSEGGAALVGVFGAKLTPSRLAAVVWLCVPALFAVLLVTPSVTLPGDDLGLRRFQTPQLDPGVLIGQIFSMPRDGLNPIEVFPVAVGERVSGFARFVLYDVTEGRPTRVRGTAVAADSLMRAPSYRLLDRGTARSRGGRNGSAHQSHSHRRPRPGHGAVQRPCQ